MVCTFYSHYIGLDRIIEILQYRYPNATVAVETQDEFQVVNLELKGGFLSPSSLLKIIYRQKDKPSYQLLEEDVCSLSQNLKGLFGFVDSLSSRNPKVKELFLRKIPTFNSEFSLSLEKGKIKDLKDLILNLAEKFDAVLFVQPNTLISRSDGQHFLDKNLKLIIDSNGSCEISDLAINVEAKYFASEQIPILEDQRHRRAKSEKICLEYDIPIYQNPNSLFVESDTRVKIRTKDEVVDRAISLCCVELKSEEVVGDLIERFDDKYNVKSKLTVQELDFIESVNPTSQEIVNANWRAEGFHTLLWALSYIDELRFPGSVCDISEDVKLLFSRSEQEFRDKARLRTKEEILDQADLMLRLHWACVNARVNNLAMPNKLNPSVIYERHYALNWLINYQNKDWDNVKTDT